MSSKCSDRSDLHTYAEWKSNQMNVLLAAELDRAAAERLTKETNRYVDEMKQSSNEMDKMTNFAMQKRKEDFRYWKAEIEMKLEQIRLCISELLSIDRRLDKALDTIRENSHIVEKCFEARKRRIGIFLVYDPPEKHLCKEKEVIQEVMTLHCKTKKEVNNQLRLLRKLKHEIEKDILGSISNFDLDMETDELLKKKIAIDNHTYDPQCKKSSDRNCCEKVNTSGMIKVDQWVSLTRKTIEEAEKQRQNATNLQVIGGNGLQETKEDLQNIKNSTDDAFKERIAELRDHKIKMEDHLQHIIKQLKEMESTSKSLMDQIWSFNKRIALEEAKFKGSNGDNCIKDTDKFILIEHKKSKDNVEKLKDNLACVQCSLKGLLRRKTEIEADLVICTEALLIDEYECLPMRRNIKYFIF